MNPVPTDLQRSGSTRNRSWTPTSFVVSILVFLVLAVGPTSADTPVTVEPLGELTIHPERSAPAVVESLNNADLSAELAARIDAIPARVGDRVQPGDLLARFDCRDYESRLSAQRAVERQLEAQLQLAISQLKRARNLKQARNISEEEVDRRSADAASLRAQLDAQQEAVREATLNVERCTLKAPFPAVVAERLGNVGSLASPGTPLIRLVQTDQLEISAKLRPDEAEEAAESDPIHFEYQGRRFELRKRHVLPVVDPRTRTVELRLEFVAESAPSGSSGRLVWRSVGTFVPAELLVRRDGRIGLFLTESGRARFHPLAEALEGQPARIELPPETLIVTQGRHLLSDGEPLVTVTERP